MKKSILLIMVLCILAVAMGCAGVFPSVCDDDSEGPSLLCELAEKSSILRLEDIGSGLMFVNAKAMAKGAYTPAQALIVLKDVRAALEDPVSYLFFRAVLQDALEATPELFTVAPLFMEGFNNAQIMHARDREYLKYWLDERLEALDR